MRNMEDVNDKCRTCLKDASEMISLAADHVVCEQVMSVSELIILCTSVEVGFKVLGAICPDFMKNFLF